MAENDTKTGRAADTATDTDAVMSAAPPLDYERYLPMVADLDFTEAQKRELLETLWAIMSRFVEIGFGEDPVQTVLKAKNEDSSRDNTANNVNSTDNNKS